MADDKEKKYYWLKLPRDFFIKHYILILLSKPNGREILLFYIRLMTESIDHNGRLRYSDTKAYTVESLQELTGFPLQTVTEALQICTDLELIVTESDGTIFLPKVLKMIGGESASAERVRRYRNKQSEQAESIDNSKCNSNVTQCNTENAQCNVENRDKSIDIDKDKNICPNDESLDEFFERVWKLYPKKQGKGQVSKTKKKVLQKIGFDEIKRCIDRYVAAKKTTKTDIKYYQNGSTFFNSGYVDYLDKNFKETENSNEQSGTNVKGYDAGSYYQKNSNFTGF